MLKRSKLATKEFICNECRRKTNYFARMDYTSKEAAQKMMDTLAQEEADFEASFDEAEGRFARAERSFRRYELGGKRVEYRCNTARGGFQLYMDEMSRYEHTPVFWFSSMMPYEHRPEGEVFADMRRHGAEDAGAEYVRVEKSEAASGKPQYTLIIPYDDICIKEIRIEDEVDDDDEARGFYELADRINGDRRAWLGKAEFDMERKNEMQIRNLGDTAAAALKAAITGGGVKEAVKNGIEMANDIEEGNVKQGFFGKLFKK